MEHSTEFKQCLTRLTLRNDTMFFIAILYSMNHRQENPLMIRGMRPPAATDGVTIYYDTEVFASYSPDDRQFIMVHEILHSILGHPLRRGARDPQLWGLACDFVVNGLIVDSGPQWRMPTKGIQPDPAFRGLSAEQVYDLLQKEAEKALACKGPGEKGQGKNGRVWVRADEPGDPHQLDGAEDMADLKDYDPASNENKPASQVAQEMGVVVEKAAAATKAAGQGSAFIDKLLGAARVRSEPWYAHLRRYMNALNEPTYNWARVDRRRAAYLDMIAPDRRSESMGDVMVWIDESGSLMDSQLAAIGAHVSDVARECNPKRIHVGRHTDRVTHIETYEGPDYHIALVRKSTGGTDFRPAFEHTLEEFSDVQVVLMFTDMYGPAPQFFPIDTLWITSTNPKNAPTPFGERIQADFND